MKTLFIAFFALIGTAVFAQQDKLVQDPNARPRPISGDFSAVSVASGIELYISQGSENSLAISVSDEKFRDKFKTDVVNGVLKIYYDNKDELFRKNDRKDKLKAYLSVKNVNKLIGSSGSRTVLTNTFQGSNLEMDYSSGSTFKGEVKVNSLVLEQSSGSYVELSGSASSVDMEASSGSILRGFSFSTANCEAKASSGSMVNISISSEIEARASSGAIIKYKGAGVVKSMNVSSGGVVKKA